MKCYIHPDVEAIGACTSCGKAVCPACSVESNGKVVCKSCAEKIMSQNVSQQNAAGKKDPVMALILSIAGIVLSILLSWTIIGIVFFGLGQIYNGHVKKGIALAVLHAIAGIVIILIYIIGSAVTLGIGLVLCAPIFLVPVAIWVYAVYDAYTSAKKMSSGEQVKDWLS